MNITKQEELFKVYVQTKDHPHVLEMIVSAGSPQAAKARALGHVKEANPTKGRSLEESQSNSIALFAKRAGKNGCLVTNKLPVKAFEAVSRAVEAKAALVSENSPP
jgi:hypothetical protein